MRSNKLGLLATIIGSGIVFLDGTIVTLALPTIAGDFHAGFSSLQWIAAGFLLSLSSLILLGGSLGDIFGRRRVFLIGLGGFGISSLLCGLSPNTDVLIAFRILQGVFGALLVPSSLAIINTSYAKADRGAAIGLWSAWAGAFTAIGPLLGGYLLGAVSWRWIFFINVPLVLICMILTARGVKETKKKLSRKLDVIGSAVITLALAGITYGLIEGPVNHWKVNSMTALLGGALLLLYFIFYESREADPIVNLNLFKSRNFTGANLATFAMYGALGGFLFSLVIYLQTKMGYSAIKAGLSMIPVTVMLLLFSSRVGRLSSKYGSRLFMTFGPLFAAIGMVLLARLQPGDNYVTQLLPGVLLFAIGMVLNVAPLTTTVMSSVKQSSSGIASAINNAIARIAGLLVIALLGLTGTSNTYRFGMFLCACFAAAAGILAYAIVRNPQS
jgi:EmrB/QacA subfamily drug resistance transporter